MAEPLVGGAWAYYSLTIMGETGVDLFFVLSGFLITGILIDTRNDKHNFKHFYIRRALRIFPLYYAVLLIFIVYFLFIFGLDGLDNSKIIMHLLYVQNWMFSHNTDQFILLDHTWSLAVEEQFYLFWPLLLLSVYNAKSVRSMIILCVAMVALSWGLRLFFGGLEHFKLAYTPTISRLDGLALGGLLSILCIHKRDMLLKYRKWLPYVMGVCLGGITYMLSSQKAAQDAHDLSVTYGLIIFSILYVCLLAYVFLSPNQNILKQILSRKPIREVGRISYGMYLFHVPVMMIMVRFVYDLDLGYWLSHFIVLFSGGILSFGLAYLSYNHFEKRFLLLKKKYAPLGKAGVNG